MIPPSNETRAALATCVQRTGERCSGLPRVPAAKSRPVFSEKTGAQGAARWLQSQREHWVNTRSLKFGLVAWYAGWLSLLFAVFGIFVFGSLRYYLRKGLHEALARRTRQVAELVIRSQDNWQKLSPIVEVTFASEANNRFTRMTIDGKLLHVSGAPADGSFDPATVPPPPAAGPREVFGYRTLPGQSGMYIVVLRREVKGHQLIVEEGASAEGLQVTMRRWMVALLGGLGVLICGAVMGGFALVQRALAPVDEITRTAERISLQNLNSRLPVKPTGDELERLSLALNNMIDRIDASFEHTRRFLADASHELRTPLTIIHAELDALLENSGTADARARSANSALEETERLQKIVNALFALSHFDAGEVLLEMIPMDLCELVTNTAEQFRVLAEDKQIEIQCSCPGPVIVRGDRARLKQVLVNLLDNAIKYTPAGRIELRVKSTSAVALLEVSDTGIGIPKDSLPHIFERFYRVDKARSREMGGAGLGLSIVKAICTAHGGDIHVQSVPGGGAKFVVELPLNEVAEAKLHAAATYAPAPLHE